MPGQKSIDMTVDLPLEAFKFLYMGAQNIICAPFFVQKIIFFPAGG
jgi:hypothetical protein